MQLRRQKWTNKGDYNQLQIDYNGFLCKTNEIEF